MLPRGKWNARGQATCMHCELFVLNSYFANKVLPPKKNLDLFAKHESFYFIERNIADRDDSHLAIG